MVAKGIDDLTIDNFSYNQKINVALTETRLASKDFGNAFGYLDKVAGSASKETKKSHKSRAKREKEAE